MSEKRTETCKHACGCSVSLPDENGQVWVVPLHELVIREDKLAAQARMSMPGGWWGASAHRVAADGWPDWQKRNRTSRTAGDSAFANEAMARR